MTPSYYDMQCLNGTVPPVMDIAYVAFYAVMSDLKADAQSSGPASTSSKL